jgi:hypothetical protein
MEDSQDTVDRIERRPQSLYRSAPQRLRIVGIEHVKARPVVVGLDLSTTRYPSNSSAHGETDVEDLV